LCSPQSHNNNNNNDDDDDDEHAKMTVRNDLTLCQKMVQNDLKLRQFLCVLQGHSRKERKEEKYEQKTKAIHPNPLHIGVS